MKAKKPLAPLIPLEDLKKVVAGLIAVPKAEGPAKEAASDKRK